MDDSNKIYFEIYKSISKKHINIKDADKIIKKLDDLSINKEVNEKENSILYTLENNQQIKLQSYEGKIELLYNFNPKVINELEDLFENDNWTTNYS